MQFALDRQEYDRLFDDALSQRYPKGASAVCTECKSRGVKATAALLHVLIEAGDLPEMPREGRERRWNKKDIDRLVALLYSRDYLTPRTEMLAYLNIDPVSYIEAVREAEKTGRAVDVQTMTLTPANPALGEMRQVRFE